MSALPSPEGEAVPVLLLTFAWEDTGLLPPQNPEWLPASSHLKIHEKGLQVTLDGLSLLFPLVDASGQTRASPGLDRSLVLDLIERHGFLHACALDSAGDILASIGFALKA